MSSANDPTGPGRHNRRARVAANDTALVKVRRRSLPRFAPARRWLTRAAAFAGAGVRPDGIAVGACEAGFQVPSLRARQVYGAALEGSINPAQLTDELADWVRTPAGVRHTLDWFLASGPWTGLLRRAGKLAVYQEAQELWSAGLRFRQTAAYAACQRALREGRPLVRQHRPLDSGARIDAYFSDFASLFESIARHGVHRPGPSAWLDLWQPGRHIAVAIAADGSLVKLPGAKHRVAIAGLLGLPRIPVRVAMIHSDFLRARGVTCLSAAVLIQLLAQIEALTAPDAAPAASKVIHG